ncbi:hypothetical protein MKW98_011417 [Papaver atlanticum]|uniref:Uncharacterized protein n=1 Tax=Papaver atlanticum TaxID=357466 RepID=A0AAD4XEB8_9MAGN|nr:hypothetical protein MKW98_011417 [Papaver atlanticum]
MFITSCQSTFSRDELGLLSKTLRKIEIESSDTGNGKSKLQVNLLYSVGKYVIVISNFSRVYSKTSTHHLGLRRVRSVLNFLDALYPEY